MLRSIKFTINILSGKRATLIYSFCMIPFVRRKHVFKLNIEVLKKYVLEKIPFSLYSFSRNVFLL